MPSNEWRRVIPCSALKFWKWLYFLIMSNVLRSGKKLDQQPTMSAENFAELSRLVKVLAETK